MTLPQKRHDHGSVEIAAASGQQPGDIKQAFDALLAPWNRLQGVYRCDAIQRAFRISTNELRFDLPSDQRAMRNLFGALPSRHDLTRLREDLQSRPRAAATFGQIAQAAGCILAAKSIRNDRLPTVIEGLACTIYAESHGRNWPILAIAAGVYQAAMQTTFVPDASEIVPRIQESAATLRKAPALLGMLRDARTDLALMLVEDGADRAEFVAAGDLPVLPKGYEEGWS